MPSGTVVPLARRSRGERGAPSLPAGAVTPEREPIAVVLSDEAERKWRTATGAWVPTLASLVARGVGRITVGEVLTVEMPNATYRARGVGRPWVAVMVAMLTGQEIVPVRRALRAGERVFAR